MRKRNHTITFRMTTAEYELLKYKVALANISEQSYIINSITNSKISSSDDLEELKNISSQYNDLLRQLKGIANNINQIAKAANTAIKSGQLYSFDELDIDEISEQLNQIQQELEQQWKEVRRKISNGN